MLTCALYLRGLPGFAFFEPNSQKPDHSLVIDNGEISSDLVLDPDLPKLIRGIGNFAGKELSAPRRQLHSGQLDLA
jgi:hypothetical protein